MGLAQWHLALRWSIPSVRKVSGDVGVTWPCISHSCILPPASPRLPDLPGGRPSAPQDVFLMIRRHKTTIFTDAKESSTVFELKRIVEGILKRPPDEQRLYKVRPREGSGRGPGWRCAAAASLVSTVVHRVRRTPVMAGRGGPCRGSGGSRWLGQDDGDSLCRGGNWPRGPRRNLEGGGSLPLSLLCPPDEAFEALRIEPFSSPPELPDVMKPQDSGSSANEQAVQ
ncbi:elongin-B [Crocuta crocuta]